MQKKLLSFSRSFVAWFAIVLFFFLMTLSLVYTAYMRQEEVVFFKWDFFPLTLLLIALVLAFLFLLYRLRVWEKLSLRSLRVALVAYVLLMGTAWVFMARNPPYADAQYVYGFAQGFVAGDFTTIPEHYLGRFPFQLGLALYYEFIMRLVGPDCFYFLQMLNVGYVALSYLLLTHIASEILQSEAARFFTCILLFGCLPPLLFVTFVYGTQLGLLFALAGLYAALRFMRQGKVRFIVIMALCTGLAVVIKQNYWIFAIGITLVLALHFIQKISVKTVAAVAALLVMCFSLPQLVYLSYELRSDYKVEKGIPAVVYISMGMQEGERGPGWFNGYTSWVFDGEAKNYDEAKEQAYEDMGARWDTFIKDPLYAARFYTQKIASEWADPTFAGIQVSYFGNNNLLPLGYIATSLFWGGLRDVMETYMEIYLVLIYAGCFAYFLLHRKKLEPASLLLVIVVIGGFLFHLMWEAKSQYCWPYFVLCIPYAAGGITTALEKLDAKIPKRSPKKAKKQKSAA